MSSPRLCGVGRLPWFPGSLSDLLLEHGGELVEGRLLVGGRLVFLRSLPPTDWMETLHAVLAYSVKTALRVAPALQIVVGAELTRTAFVDSLGLVVVEDLGGVRLEFTRNSCRDTEAYDTQTLPAVIGVTSCRRVGRAGWIKRGRPSVWSVVHSGAVPCRCSIRYR
jgi:hypothetical protein